jgi:hypothetical protein
VCLDLPNAVWPRDERRFQPDALDSGVHPSSLAADRNADARPMATS